MIELRGQQQPVPDLHATPFGNQTREGRGINMKSVLCMLSN